MAEIPDKPALEGLEQKWDAAWSAQGTYLFDRARAAASAPLTVVATARTEGPALAALSDAHRPHVQALALSARTTASEVNA